MSTTNDPRTATALDALLDRHGLTRETCLYRATRAEYLSDGPAGSLVLSANEKSPEAVVDVYGQGHTVVAEQLGAGLALAEREDNAWRALDRTMVEVRLADVLSQGGLLYPVQSVVTEKVWFATLPRGSVAVRAVG